MSNSIITFTAVTVLAALLAGVSISAPSSAKGGDSAVATGTSTAGPDDTSVLAFLDGVELDVEVAWNGNQFTATVEVPGWDPESDNLIEWEVSSGSETDSASTTINP